MLDPIDRRTLFRIGFAAAVANGMPTAIRAARPRKRLLILGGTNYVGPHIVHSALRAGHEVTLFNRGLTNVHLFPDLERLRGDRSRADGLAELQGTRIWDAVIDTWSRAPRAVEASAALLAGRTGRYSYVSSIAVYGSFHKIGLNEDDPILPLSRRPAGDGDEVGYAWAKRLAEASVERHFPQSHLIARGSSIFGFDFSARADNQNIYWPIRLRAGGRVVAPGDGSDLVQYTDVGSIADFIVDNVDGAAGGSFNVAAQPITFRTFLETIRSVLGRRGELVWIPKAFLVANGVAPFEQMPLWIPADDAEPGFFRFDTARAHAAGMRPCALRRTIAGVLTAFDRTPAGWQPYWESVGGLPADMEDRVLRNWHVRAS